VEIYAPASGELCEPILLFLSLE